MGRSAKTPKITEFNTLPNAFGEHTENGSDWRPFFAVHSEGDSNKQTKDSDRPKLIVELACGKAELSRGLAAKYPDTNFIAVDILAPRLWRAATYALHPTNDDGADIDSPKLNNIAFLQTDIRKLLEVFNPGEIDELWITFPDPWPKDRHAKHRLFGREFLALYSQVLKPGGVIKCKTDSAPLMDFLRLEEIPAVPWFEEIKHAPDLYDNMLDKSKQWVADAQIQTTFERKWLAQGDTIQYAEFKQIAAAEPKHQDHPQP